jgi:hypothetical protein
VITGWTEIDFREERSEMGTGAWVDSQHPRDSDGKFASGEGSGSSSKEPQGHVGQWQGHVGQWHDTSADDDWSQHRGVKAGEWKQEIYSFSENPGETHLKTVPFDEADKMLAKGDGSKERPWDFPAIKSALEKQFTDVKAKPGEQIVYRVGNKGLVLTHKNAGNLEGVITFAASQSSDTRGHNITAYSVKIPKYEGAYLSGYVKYRGNKPLEEDY